MTYTKETGKKWENENGKASHMKVSMVHDEEECEKECTATVPSPSSLGWRSALSRLPRTPSPWCPLVGR